MIPTTRVAIILNNHMDMTEMDIKRKKMNNKKENMYNQGKGRKGKKQIFRNKTYFILSSHLFALHTRTLRSWYLLICCYRTPFSYFF